MASQRDLGLGRLPNAPVQAREDLDVELIRHRSGLTLREFVKGCWRRGLNPRVYNPFLPHGLEERLGVTYQGRDVESAKVIL